MVFKPTIHDRDFSLHRTQRPLAELRADAQGFVRFNCSKCPRTGKVRLAKLRERFPPTEGLVDILLRLTPTDCEFAERSPWGTRQCGFCYRDLDCEAPP
ncbi:hypothetical protein DJ021_08700 [Phenylobacterium hankyongense]|uniref:Uncharacterized protein n=2 Tax=Phenylobacterium hankyongense TaxID=1813876 RepID=A0A328AZ05_9CAUL|nr:hypothetical protein DJ021_08700 [Phenylobacterium hankyongense]